MKFSITAASRMGCVRQNNEDMILVGDWFIRNGRMNAHFDTDNTDRYLIALADGMGGHNSGEVASSDVLHNLHYFFSDLPIGLDVGSFNEAIYEWLSSMNNIIDSKGREDERYHNMGTTLVAVCYYGGEFYWMNCGDSRLYRLRDGKLAQLSTDHSLSTLMGSDEHTSIITNCIGGGCKTSFIDIINFTSDILPGDRLLLCSDGLSDMISNDQIATSMSEGQHAEQLCLEAESAGGNDNVSCIVISIE